MAHKDRETSIIKTMTVNVLHELGFTLTVQVLHELGFTLTVQLLHEQLGSTETVLVLLFRCYINCLVST